MDRVTELSTGTIQDYVRVLWRRKLLFIVSAGSVLVAAAFFAFTQQLRYVSVGRVLIEDQALSQSLIGASAGGFASQQIRTLSQRVLTVENIFDIATSLEVYGPAESIDSESTRQVAEWFREDTLLELVSTDIIDPRSRGGEVAIAFDIGFVSTSPDTAKNVAEELVELFLAEDRRVLQYRASGVSQFLAQEVEEANEELVRAETELVDFKTANDGALPEQYRSNVSAIERAEQGLVDTEFRIQQLEQRQIELSAQLATMSPFAATQGRPGSEPVDDSEQLRVLMAEYRRKSARYREGHPDLRKLEREISSLQESLGTTIDYKEIASQLDVAEQELADLLRRYDRDHPDVLAAQATVNSLERQLASEGAPQGESLIGTASSPAYVLVQGQLDAVKSEFQRLIRRDAELKERVERLQVLIRRAPEVEVGYEARLRRYQGAEATLIDLQSKLRAAEVAGQVEEEFSGRRFTLIEPPAMPLEPVGANRQGILVLGFVLAIGVGLGLVILVEAFDDRIYGSRQLEILAGEPPLVTIPSFNPSKLS